MSAALRSPSFPRLPVLGLDTLAFGRTDNIPSVLDSGPALLTTSGRTAILHALHALGVGRGDRVLLPTYHCPTMVAPVVRAGAIPVFYPITSEGDADHEFLASDAARGSKALLAVHFFGLPRPLDEVRRWCDQHGVALIEDCAHAFFGTSGDRTVGSSGNVSVASLPKFFPVQSGGVLAGPRKLLDLVHLRPAAGSDQVRGALDPLELGSHYGRLGALGVPLRFAFRAKARLRNASRDHTRVGLEDRPVDKIAWLDETRSDRAAPWVTKLLVERTDRRRLILARRRNYTTMSGLFADIAGARPLMPELPEGAVPYVFPLELDVPDRAYHAIRSAGVPVFRWDRLWPATPELPDDTGRHWARHVLQLGCHQDLSEKDCVQIAQIVNAALIDHAE